MPNYIKIKQLVVSFADYIDDLNEIDEFYNKETKETKFFTLEKEVQGQKLGTKLKKNKFLQKNDPNKSEI